MIPTVKLPLLHSAHSLVESLIRAGLPLDLSNATLNRELRRAGYTDKDYRRRLVEIYSVYRFENETGLPF